MNVFHLFLIPPVAFLFYALYRMAVGTPLQKRIMNIVSAIFLMVFFFMTAGLGIFWVANKELPVFDLHYLFGYVTLILVIVHLIFNWPQLSTFFRKFSPDIFVDKGKRTWRPAAGFFIVE